MAVKISGLSVVDNTRNIVNANTISIGATEICDSSRNLSNIGTFNSHTIPGGTGTLALTSDIGITAAVAGDGLTGGGSSGSVTLNVGSGTGISVTADAVALATAGAGAATYSTGISAITVDAYGRVTSVTGSAGYTTNTGDIEGVTAGDGLTGGGTSGSVTLNVGAGNGIDVAADSISVESDLRGDVFYIGQDTSDYIHVNTTVIDFYLDGNLDMRLENNGDLEVDGDVTAYSTTTSDQKFKDNVFTIENALDKVCAMRGVEFDWNATSRRGEHDIGVIAQEVEAVVPHIVREKTLQTGEFVDNPTSAKTVDYDKLTAVLIEAVKELKAEIEILKASK